MRNFTDKVIWITGASSGIGKEMAIQCNKMGAKVVLSSRIELDLIKVQEQLLFPENSIIIPLDLANLIDLQVKIEEVIKKFNSIDLLFNNGGISQRSWACDTLLEVDRKIMEVNFFGTVQLTKSILPLMQKQGHGHIAVVSSLSGKFGFFQRSAYAASKHALHGFFETLRLEEFQNNIKITMLCPGPVYTNISFNAMNGEGSKNDKPDEMQEKGMPVETCIERMISAIKNDKKEVIIGMGLENLSLKIKALFPGLFFKLLMNRKPYI